MAGASTNTRRSAYVVNDAAGSFPATPTFKTLPTIIDMKSVATFAESRSQISGGARDGQSIESTSITGTVAGPLIYGIYDDLLATLCQSFWASNILKNGTAPNALAVETTVSQGAGGAPAYMRFPGVEAMGGKLKLSSKSAAQISFDLFGIGAGPAVTTLITGATYTDPTEKNPISSGIGVGTITMGGMTVDCISDLEIDFAFDKRDPQPKIGTDLVNGVRIEYCGVSRGAMLPMIKLKMYVETGFLDMYNTSRTDPQTPFSMSIPLGTVTGKKYIITFPRCFLTESTLDAGGADEMHDITVAAHFNAATNCVVQITRAVV